MADWYVSSVAYAAIPQYAASTSYTVGQIVRPLTAPAVGHAHVFRCTTAGTSGAEPAWPAGNNATVTSGATFTNVTAQSTYGWGAAAGDLYSILGGGGIRTALGDRVFLSSDHAENQTSATVVYAFGSAGTGYGVVQAISVNRAGSVPPVAADIQNGAAITLTGTGTNVIMTLQPAVSAFWQGVTFTMGGTATAQSAFDLSGGGHKTNYFKNCAFVFTCAGTSGGFINNNNIAKVVFDNTTVSFNQTFQVFLGLGCWDVTWINTPNALPGPAVPTFLFNPTSISGMHAITCRGVDLSALTTILVITSSNSSFYQTCKALFESCKIAPGVIRLGVPGINTAEEVELVNCWDGTNVINERWTQAGNVAADRVTYLNSGAQDDIGNYSLKMLSSSRSDFLAMPLDCFSFDVENTVTGASKTATVEVVSSFALNNNDIRLLLEYMGTSGNPVASFGDTLASVLTAATALPTSSNTWTGPASTTWNPNDLLTAALSNGNLTVISSGSPAGVRTMTGFTSGKYYWEVTVSTWAQPTTTPGFSLATVAINSGTGNAYLLRAGAIMVNGVNSGSSLGARTSGDIIGIAIDFGSNLCWFRVAPSGNWNGSGTANPATGTGGISISSIATGPLFPYCYLNAAGETMTANFGASGFSGAVPSGFAAGWPGTPASKQLLQVTFTPQRAGRVRGIVRLGKPSVSVWVDPRITIA